MSTARVTVVVVMVVAWLVPAAAATAVTDYVTSSYVGSSYVDPAYVVATYAAAPDATPTYTGPASSEQGPSSPEGVALPPLSPPRSGGTAGSPITTWDAIGLVAMALGAAAALGVRRRARRVGS